MDEVFKVFEQLETLTSVVEKEELLKKHTSSANLTALLDANLNSYRQFYMKKMPSDDFKTPNMKQDILKPNAAVYKFLILLADLECRAYTGNAAKKRVAGEFQQYDDKCYKLFEKILFKRPIGVGRSTVNAAYGMGLVQLYSHQSYLLLVQYL